MITNAAIRWRAWTTLGLLPELLAWFPDNRASLDYLNGAVVSPDPLAPAFVRIVEYWSDGGRPVRVLHDQQRTLTPERIAALGALNGRLAAPAAPVRRRALGGGRRGELGRAGPGAGSAERVFDLVEVGARGGHAAGQIEVREPVE